MSKQYPHLKIETIDKNEPPTASNLRIFYDGVEISSVVAGVKFEAMAGDICSVTLHLYASVEMDGMVMKTGGEL